MLRRSFLFAVALLACVTTPPASTRAPSVNESCGGLSCPAGLAIAPDRCWCAPEAPPSATTCPDGNAGHAALALVRDRNDGALVSVLEKSGLERVELAAGPWIQTPVPADQPPVEETGPAPWSIVTEPGGRRVLYGEPANLPCWQRPPPPPTFARDADGRIHRLELAPVSIGRYAPAICGCPPAPYAGCGAPSVERVQPAWVLPGEAEYAGSRRIEYPVLESAPSYAPPAPCAPPSMPPSTSR